MGTFGKVASKNIFNYTAMPPFPMPGVTLLIESVIGNLASNLMWLRCQAQVKGASEFEWIGR